MADMNSLASSMAGMTPEQSMQATQVGINALQRDREQDIQQQRADISQQNVELQRQELARRKTKDAFSRSMQKREMALAAQAQHLKGMLTKARMDKNEALERQAYEEAKNLKLRRNNLKNMKNNFQKDITTNTGERMSLMEMITLNSEFDADIKPADQEVLGTYKMPDGETKFMLADPTSDTGYRIVSEPELKDAERAADQKIEQLSVEEKARQGDIGKVKADMQSGSWANEQIKSFLEADPLRQHKLMNAKFEDKKMHLKDLKGSLETHVASTYGIPSSKVELKEGKSGRGFYNTETQEYLAAPPVEMTEDLLKVGDSSAESDQTSDNTFTYQGGKLK